MLVDVVDDSDAVISVEAVGNPCLRFGALGADVVAGEGGIGGRDVRDWCCGGREEEEA